MHLVTIFDYSDFCVFASRSYIKCKIVECKLNLCGRDVLIKMLLWVLAIFIEYDVFLEKSLSLIL